MRRCTNSDAWKTAACGGFVLFALVLAFSLAGASESLDQARELRRQAEAADAARLAPDAWEQAERDLSEATRLLEAGKTDKAETRGAEAAANFSAAELAAIKARRLTSVRSLIVQAADEGAERYAPRSYALAQDALAEAEAALDADRYATSPADELAVTAAYEARHALTITGIARRVKAKELSVEDVILDGEAPLRRLAEVAGQTADLAEGSADTENALRQELLKLPILEAALVENRRQIAGLEEEIHDLDERLSNAGIEREALVRELQARDRLREQFGSVEALFTPDEAIVLRDGNQLILRMVGLRFGSGSSRLDDDATALLDRLRDAVNIFPGSQLVVEGHTDASGDADNNRDLSERRARAVADYLITSLGIQSFRIQAVGYGDTRPIAGNRTKAGRAQNRRIDILLDTRTDS